MKRLSKTFGILSALLLAASLLMVYAVPVQAAEDYTYTVRFFAGKQGTIGGGEVLTFTDLHYGDRVTFNQNTVKLNDGARYYIRGIRESGRDNNTIYATSFEVTEDRDYVVAYGILGSAVAYTINYVDEDGSELAPSETYYGNVGDMPVIAYLYIENYQPQAYNLIKTLSENAAENVFTFIYSPVAGYEEQPGEETPGGETPGGETPGGETPGGETPGGETPGGAAPAAPGAVTPGAAAPGTVVPGAVTPGGLTAVDDEGTPLAQPGAIDNLDDGQDNLQSIDDNDTPLSNTTINDDGQVVIAADATPFGKRPVIIICVAVIAAVLLGWFIFLKKKEKKNEA